MLSGENGILTKGTQASEETIHANVYEQLKLKATEYFIGKSLGNAEESTLIEHLQSEIKPIIGDELGEEGSGKYQINVENLLGTTQKYGNGTATGSDTSTYKDVYMIEKIEPETGSIINTKLASNKPIKIASNNENNQYTVKYYGTKAGLQNGKLLGNIGDTAKGQTDIATKIMKYLNDPNSYSYDRQLVTNLGINEGDLKNIGAGYYRYKDGKIYKATYEYDNEIGNFAITKVEHVNMDATIDPVTETLTTPFGTYKKYVEGEENNYLTWESNVDANGNRTYEVINENNGFYYYYDTSGRLVLVRDVLG